MRSAELLHVGILRPRLEQVGHVERLGVMVNHALHELDVGLGRLRHLVRAAAGRDERGSIAPERPD